MRRLSALLLLCVVAFLSACAPRPTVIIEKVPQTVIVTATIASPAVTSTLGPSLTPPATTLPTPIETPLFTAVVTADVLTLRSGPDDDSEAIGALEKGCELQAIGRTEEGDWLKVEFQGIPGWVTTRYVELSVPLNTILIVARVPGPPGTALIPPDHGVSAQVLRVIDGDTIEVSIDGETYKVRYIGIDTPETKHPEKPVEWMGPEAAAQNEKLVGGKTVILEKDVSETDKYGRLLRYVWVGDLMVNAELVRLGYAQVSTYPPDVKYQDLFLQLQREAREAGRGLWGARRPTPTPPADGYVIADVLNLRAGPGVAYKRLARLPADTPLTIKGCTEDRTWLKVVVGDHTGWVAAEYVTLTIPEETISIIDELAPTPTAPPITLPPPSEVSPTATPAAPAGKPNVQITHIFYDGLVYRVESDEYVEITNLGNAPQDLAGWRLIDISEGYPSFTFPHYILEPGAKIRVYTNEIHPEWDGFSFGFGKAAWNNKEPDVAALYDTNGNEVSRRSY